MHFYLRNVKLRSKEKKNTKNNGGLQAIIPEFGKTKAHQHRISFCHTDDYTDYSRKAPKFESILLHTSGNQENTIPVITGESSGQTALNKHN